VTGKQQWIKTTSGESYVVTNSPFGDISDIQWIAVDDQFTYDAFNQIFKEMNIPQRFAHLVSGSINMFSASFVVRSRCEKPNSHVDYHSSVGTQGFSLMTPIRNYNIDHNSANKFQLLYEKRGPEKGQPYARYNYSTGKALVFASQFKHSTEPGKSSEPGGAPHVFLCFAFGSDDPRYWPLISQTVGTQSRMVSKANGELQLSESFLGPDVKGEIIEGRLHMEKEEFLKAASAFEKVIKLAPENGKILLELGIAYMNSASFLSRDPADYDRAQTALEKAERMLPDNKGVYDNLKTLAHSKSVDPIYIN
jgi:tetratricopeptide (TPR) repeat protein